MTRLAELRRYAVARSLFAPTTLPRAISHLGFVQADPIRAPARAQDLILRHRVAGYRASDLDRRYPALDVEEDYFVNYGFLPASQIADLHPRPLRGSTKSLARRRIEELLAFARARPEVHPRDAGDYFSHGRITNYWGGVSSATTHLLDRMHYHGLLRVARRDNGIRVYAARDRSPCVAAHISRHDQARALLRLIAQTYAPLPARGLASLANLVRHAAPQLRAELKLAVADARSTWAHAKADGTLWYWPVEESPTDFELAEAPSVRLLAPFDPVVWDRDRFERFWGWRYRFEAYTRPAKRKFGYYALPLLWGERVIGWGNVSVADGKLGAQLHYVSGRPPRERRFREELATEIDRIKAFLRAG
jgi:uncharacterized protein YcaQ